MGLIFFENLNNFTTQSCPDIPGVGVVSCCFHLKLLFQPPLEPILDHGTNEGVGVAQGSLHIPSPLGFIVVCVTSTNDNRALALRSLIGRLDELTAR